MDYHSKFKFFFPKHINYGIIELDKFCDYGVGLLEPSKQISADQGKSNERDYCAIVYRQCFGGCHKIYFAILWNTSVHNKVLLCENLFNNAIAAMGNYYDCIIIIVPIITQCLAIWKLISY